MHEDDSQIIFNRISIKRLRDASLRLRKKQRFNFFSLKFLHDSTFDPTPDLPDSVRVLMKDYYKVRPAANDWHKLRLVSRLERPHLTLYSPLQSGDFHNAETAIKAALPENMADLNLAQKIERLTTVYAEIDYLHGFGDGNSRVNRAFVQEMARASGIVFDFANLDYEVMYVARDKSLCELNLARRPDDLKDVFHPYEGNAYIGLQKNLSLLKQAYPGITLNSIFANIAKPLEIDKLANKIEFAEFLHNCYMDNVKLSNIEKITEKNRLTQALKKSSPEQIDIFTDMLRKNLQNFLERGSIEPARERNKNEGRER
ncbi:Fic family protein [Cardiobacterium valvarum]|uniref:Fido domain-containing protein n=2 Tax=Cardiobacterium valvarum TaxID=194702 RepID=G9ZDA8_9GAMM|nr:Fic family protein [Cardiobacterium valvarum]EHM55436.1 hypothetical protein HMPREF9080_00742 [Cardiobacterium valvarum F0432]